MTELAIGNFIERRCRFLYDFEVGGDVFGEF